MVDTVWQFEGDRHYALSYIKNIEKPIWQYFRTCIYEMTDEGMKGVNNPSEILITQKEEQLSGIAIAATIGRITASFDRSTGTCNTVCIWNTTTNCNWL